VHLPPRLTHQVGLAALLFLTPLGVVLSPTALASDCPPSVAKFGPPKPVPGKAGEMGWLLEEEVDQAGNKLQTWCLQALAGKHGGPDFGSLWKPTGAADEDAVWVGACTFPQGRNQPNKGFAERNNDGVPDLFTTLTWVNVQPPPDGTNDWEYSYDTATNKLTVKKTKGVYERVNDPQTGKLKGHLYKHRSVVDTDTYDAPKEFKGLHFKDTQISYLSGRNGVSAEAMSLEFETVSPAGVWAYVLRVNNQGGSGTESDPFVGFMVSLIAEDTLTLAAADMQYPFVTGLAALPQYGGWVVDSFTSNAVTFRATSSADFIPGTLIDGFGFSSNGGPGELMPWDLASSNEQIGSSGVVLSPSRGTTRDVPIREKNNARDLIPGK
jgi:hypothetical protein